MAQNRQYLRELATFRLPRWRDAIIYSIPLEAYSNSMVISRLKLRNGEPLHAHGQVWRRGRQAPFKILNSGNYLAVLTLHCSMKRNSPSSPLRYLKRVCATTSQCLSHDLWFSTAMTYRCLSAVFRFSGMASRPSSEGSLPRVLSVRCRRSWL